MHAPKVAESKKLAMCVGLLEEIFTNKDDRNFSTKTRCSVDLPKPNVYVSYALCNRS